MKIDQILILLAFTGILFSCNHFRTGSTSPSEANTPAAQTRAENFEKEEIAEIEWHITPEKIKEEFRKKSETLLEEQETESFYKTRGFSPAWTETNTLTTFYKALLKADEEGLFFKNYHGKMLSDLLERSAELNEYEIASLDILLTDAFLSYAHDLYYGKIDPKELYKNWGVSRKQKDLKKLLQQGIEEKNVTGILEQLKPTQKIYCDLKIALSEYKELKRKDEQPEKIAKGDLIKPGEKDLRLPAISKRLQELGLLAESTPESDTIYSEELEKSIKQFQKTKGLQVDGIIGNSTLAELNMSPEERYNQILANLERWRWYPRDLGEHYILINIPQFKLAVVKDGDTIRTHNVIAGRKTRQTPVFTDTLEYIVINPQWHIPPTIKYEDIIPQVAKNPSYLNSHNMKVIGRNGMSIDPTTIDWSGPEVRSFNFVQSAGPSNPLGQVKIIYPNRYLIYLHDTPAKRLFSHNQRAESSGCVRVENAVDLSAYILSNQKDWSEESIRETIASGKTKEVKINRPIQIHHFYWTAWRADDNTVFTEDIYSLDRTVYTKLLN